MPNRRVFCPLDGAIFPCNPPGFLKKSCLPAAQNPSLPDTSPIFKQALAGSRKQYAGLIAYLKKIRTSAGHEDAELAARWRAAYPRRRSMLKELHRAGYGPAGAPPRPVC